MTLACTIRTQIGLHTIISAFSVASRPDNPEEDELGLRCHAVVCQGPLRELHTCKAQPLLVGGDAHQGLDHVLDEVNGVDGLATWGSNVCKATS